MPNRAKAVTALRPDSSISGISAKRFVCQQAAHKTKRQPYGGEDSPEGCRKTTVGLT
jgi:hypothetical protein